MKLLPFALGLFEKVLPGLGSSGHLAATGRLPILIVDDEEGSLFLLSRTLKRCRLQYQDHEIDMASSVKAARERLKVRKFAVAFLDIRMPGEITGIEFGKELENDYPDMRVILFPGNLDDLKEIGTSTFFEGIGKGLYIDHAIERALRRSGEKEPADTRTTVIFYLIWGLTLAIGILMGEAGFISWLNRQIAQ